MLPKAGDEITDVLVKEFLVEFATAEKIKMIGTKKKIDNPYANAASNTVSLSLSYNFTLSPFTCKKINLFFWSKKLRQIFPLLCLPEGKMLRQF